MIKEIKTGGISYLAPLDGSEDWYWGTDFTSGDLYEAEELWRDGHRIRRLCDNRICGTDERFRWDAVTDDGRTVSNGIYIVFVRVWNLEGRTKNYRRVVTVARK